MKKIIVSLTLLFVSVFALTPLAHAQSFMEGGDRVLLGRDEIVNHDYFAAGENVTVSGVVNGDAYLAGSSVTVDGTVNGDLLIAGSDLTIRGVVKGDIRAGGANVTISGTVGGNLTVGAGKVYVTESAIMNGSIVAGAGDMTIAAPIAKGITAGVGTMKLAESVKGDVNYWSEQELELGPDATVSGTVTRHDVPKQDKNYNKAAAGAVAGGVTVAAIGGLISMFILGALLIHFAPNYVTSVVKKMRTHTGQSLFVGFSVMILIPVFVIILLITFIGIPLAFLALMLFVISLIVVKVLAGILVGTRVLSYFGKDTNMYVNLGVGLILYSLLMLIPVVGWIVTAGAYLITFGGMLLHHRDFYLALRSKKLL